MEPTRIFKREKFRLLINKRLTLLLAFISIAIWPVIAQDIEVPRTRTFPGIENPAFPYAQPEEVGISSDKLNRLGDEIESWVANGELVGGELLIIKDGKAVFHEAYGWADREERRPMERNSIFSIKSMSKPFTALAILMLVEEGKLSLDDPVKRFVKTITNDSTTVRHLLTHTSGFAGLGFNVDNFDTLKEWVENWAKDGPEQAFGRYSYSDFNYAALGYIIEEVSGKPVDSFIEERIINPLGLNETFTTFSPTVFWAERMNSRYRLNEKGTDYEKYWTNREHQGWTFYPAAWGLWATAMDYAEFMTMWMNKGHYNGVRLLSEETVKEALNSQASFGASAYGYGWYIKEVPKSNGMPFVFSHGGYDGTQAQAFPGSNSMVIYLTQSRGRGHQSALMNRLGILEIFDDPGPYSVNLISAVDWQDAEVKLSPEEQTQYLGTFLGKYPGAEEDSGLLVRVWEEGDRLHVGIGELGELANWRLHLVPLGGHNFTLGRYRDEQLEAVSPEGNFRFVVENGKAKTFEFIEENEVNFSAERVNSEKTLTDITRLRAERSAVRNQLSVADIILKRLNAKGIDAAKTLHHELLASRPDTIRFEENSLNSLGYRLLREERVEEAIVVFQMNVETYPESANPYDSLGDAYYEAGRLEDAKESYTRAIELAEKFGHEGLPTFRANLERVMLKLKEQ